MRLWGTFCFAIVIFIFVPWAARAFQLDTVLPASVPGYGTSFLEMSSKAARLPDLTGWQWDGLTFNPMIDFGAGFDSSPNGTGGGSATISETPRLVVTDPALGFGADIGATAAQYPQATAQNITGDVFAIGERAALPRETFGVSAAFLNGQETGFDPAVAAVQKPVAFSVSDLRVSDEITAGQFTLKPEVSVTGFRFDAFPMADRTDIKEGITTNFSAGGPGRFVLMLHGAESRYAATALNADTDEVLAGIADDAPELWTIRLLAGAGHRAAATGGIVTAPVLEAAVDWLPSRVDTVRVQFAREIDDPDEIAAAPYTMTEGKLSLSHDLQYNITINVSADVQNAAFLNSGLREIFFNADESVGWQVNQNLALRADAAFHDRQANQLRAANEAIITLGFTWTP